MYQVEFYNCFHQFRLYFGEHQCYPEFVHQVFKFEENEVAEGEEYVPSDVFTVEEEKYLYSLSFAKVEIIVKYDRLLKMSLPQSTTHISLSDFFKTLKNSPVYTSLTVPQEDIENFLNEDSLQVGESPNARGKIIKLKKCLMEKKISKAILERFQRCCIWFIETASLVNFDDDSFHFYVLYETTKDELNSLATLVGFNLVYKFNNPVKGDIYRICQQFILPSFQNKGIGSLLLKEVYKDLRTLKPYLINVEEPNKAFQHLRDKVELRVMQKSESVSKFIKELMSDWTNGNNSFSKEEIFSKSKRLVLQNSEIDKISKETKLDKKQIQKLLEILVAKQVRELSGQMNTNKSFLHLTEFFNTGLKLRLRGQYFPEDALDATRQEDEQFKDQLRTAKFVAVKKMFTAAKVQYSNMLEKL